MRLCDLLDLTLEARCLLVNQRFDGVGGGRIGEGMLSVTAGLKADKDKTFTLIGSADKDTGTKEINQRLSEQRMEYVYNLLKDKYGIDPSRLVKKAEGDTNNRFAEPELNRAVIVE